MLRLGPRHSLKKRELVWVSRFSRHRQHFRATHSICSTCQGKRSSVQDQRICIQGQNVFADNCRQVRAGAPESLREPGINRTLWKDSKEVRYAFFESFQVSCCFTSAHHLKKTLGSFWFPWSDDIANTSGLLIPYAAPAKEHVPRSKTKASASKAKVFSPTPVRPVASGSAAKSSVKRGLTVASKPCTLVVQRSTKKPTQVGAIVSRNQWHPQQRHVPNSSYSRVVVVFVIPKPFLPTLSVKADCLHQRNLVEFCGRYQWYQTLCVIRRLDGPPHAGEVGLLHCTSKDEFSVSNGCSLLLQVKEFRLSSNQTGKRETFTFKPYTGPLRPIVPGG